jgi:hypothetical protein
MGGDRRTRILTTCQISHPSFIWNFSTVLISLRTPRVEIQINLFEKGDKAFMGH